MIWFLAGAAVGAVFGYLACLTTNWPPLAPVRVEDRGHR
jgi:hypothetical protein